MTHAEKRRSRLERVIENARAFQEHVRPEDLAARAGEVHARPCSDGITLVSLAPSTPQRGRSGLTAKSAAELLASFAVEGVPGRRTPEKLVQSALLANAYRNERRLTWLERPEEETWLVTDELALPNDEGEKIVCDLLAVGRRGEAMVPVVIELKTARHMKRLVEQVSEYAQLVDRERDLFGALASTILGRPIALTGPVEMWIVWPSSGREVDPQEAKLAAKGIRTLSYVASEDGYSFT